MRWTVEPPTSSPEMPWWIWLFSPLWLPIVAFGAAVVTTVIGTFWLKRRLIGPTEQWRPWFAWFPVTTKPWPNEERVWLEWVERRAAHLMADAVHRLAAEAPTPALNREEADRL